MCLRTGRLSPTLTVGNMVAVEGDNETFNVTLSEALDCTVSVPWRTVAGTALAGTYSTVASGTLIYSPTQTSQTITVPTSLVAGATENLNFSVVLSDPTVPSGYPPVAVAQGTATATI